jgi:BirA family transcriptional regulator, biotin operon repressor / biotin---[acetyl-CoA-carboxylase] ligase
MSSYQGDALTFGLLRRLADGEFHSGTLLAAELGLSRARVWQVIRRCATLGIEIYRVPGRGYRLPAPMSMLDVATIRRALGAGQDAWQVQLVDTAASTNTQLMQAALASDIHRVVLAAEVQTAGRGRLGRSWQSGLGASLTFSVGWRFVQGAGALGGLSLAVGVALVRAARALGAQDVQLKWPNDLLHAARKLGGILIEMQGDALGPSTVVIGIGVNVQFPPALRAQIDQPATDLVRAGIVTRDRNLILATLLRELGTALDEFAQGGFAAFRAEWQRYHAFQNAAVVLSRSDGITLHGTAHGVDSHGALLLDTAQGRERVLSGEISLRGAARSAAAPS